jgi:hypothetical protein
MALTDEMPEEAQTPFEPPPALEGGLEAAATEDTEPVLAESKAEDASGDGGEEARTDG